MRYRLLASYQGSPYEAGIGPTDTELVLFAACPPPEELGFEPATGHWRRHIGRGDVEALWESRPLGKFGGEPCIVLDDLGDRLHIVFVGHDSYRAEQLGYWEVDRGVFELITPRQDVTDILEERRPLPNHRGQAPPGSPERAGQPADGAGAALDEPLPLEAQAWLAASAARGRPQSEPLRGTGPRAPGLRTVPVTRAPAAGPRAAPAALAQDPPGAGYLTRGAAPQAAPVARSTGPHAAIGTGGTGPHAAPVTGGTGPHAVPAGPAARPRATPVTADAGPDAVPAGRAAGPRATPGTAATGPQDAPVTTRAAAPPASPGTADTGPQPAPGGRAASSRAPVTRTAGPRAVLVTPAASAPAAVSEADGDGAGTRLAPAPGPAASAPRRRRAKQRLPTQRIFSDLASLAAIPPTAYAIGAEVDGAMCLIPSADGFEVFHAAGGGRLEARVFGDEESAYFYMFGVLVAEAVRTGVLAPRD